MNDKRFEPFGPGVRLMIDAAVHEGNTNNLDDGIVLHALRPRES